MASRINMVVTGLYAELLSPPDPLEGAGGLGLKAWYLGLGFGFKVQGRGLQLHCLPHTV